MSTETLTISEATHLIQAALVASDTSPGNAAVVAKALVRAEVDGQTGHGLSRVPSYAAQSRSGKVDGHAVPVLRPIKSSTFRVDAKHGFAYPAFDLALPELGALAQTHGIAACAIERSHHFGVAGHHCEALAEAGCAAFVYGNAPKVVAPWGTTTPLLGTNPIAFAAPAPGGPLVIDMAVTNVARGKILAARESGTSIPQGWALGPDGQPTTDPAVALKGTMAPIGDAKGVALALMVEVMSACLVGSALSAEATSLFDGDGPAPNLGQVIIALDVNSLSGGTFMSRMADLTALYDGIPGARLPGQKRLKGRAGAAEGGITSSTRLINQIRMLAGEDYA